MVLANPTVLQRENSFPVLQLQLQKNSAVGYGYGVVDEPLPVSTFGGNLRRLMARSGIRATDVAAELKVVKSAVSGWLHGKVDLPNTPTLLRLAKAVHCSVDELLDGLDPEYDKVRRDLSRHVTDQESGSSSNAGDPLDDPAAIGVELEQLRERVAKYDQEVRKMRTLADDVFQAAIALEKIRTTTTRATTRRRHDRKTG